jgi:tetratricopeptide (TPR) repeat protein
MPVESAGLESPGPIDPIAYELYLKGRYFCENWSPQEMRQGAEFLQLALERAPDFAAPHAHLALCLVDSAFFEYVQPGDINVRARSAAIRAVQLDDRLAEAHVALGSVYYYLDFEPEAAETEYLRARDLDSNSVDTLLRLSWLYAESGRFEDALGPTLRAVELDPLSTAVRNALGQVYYLNRDYDLAIGNFKEALSLDQSDPSLHYYLGLAYEQKGDYEKAIAMFEAATELSDDAPLYLSALGHALGRSGHRDGALQILEDLEQAESSPPFGLAVVHLGLENNEQALGLLEEAVASGSIHTLYLKAGPRFDPVRNDPAFDHLLQRIWE